MATYKIYTQGTKTRFVGTFTGDYETALLQIPGGKGYVKRVGKKSGGSRSSRAYVIVEKKTKRIVARFRASAVDARRRLDSYGKGLHSLKRDPSS